MKQIKISFGFHKETQGMVHISEAERGKGCNCVCLGCQSPLNAAKGNIKQHHFKHDVINEREGSLHRASKKMTNGCEGGIESAIRQAAKQKIMEKKEIMLPKSVPGASAKNSREREYTEQEFDSVQEEMELPGIKADLLAKKDNNMLIIIFSYCHKMDAQNLLKIREANLSAIEINLSDLTQKDLNSWEAFWSYINDPKHIQWLNNRKKLREKIPKQEEEYQHEEIKKLKKEHNEDWILRLDRHILQTELNKFFSLQNDKAFCVNTCYEWLQNQFREKVPESSKNYSKSYLQPISFNTNANPSSSWKTLRTYLNDQSNLGMLEFLGDDNRSTLGNRWFRIINKKPILPDTKV